MPIVQQALNSLAEELPSVMDQVNRHELNTLEALHLFEYSGSIQTPRSGSIQTAHSGLIWTVKT